ncbi:MAG: hypothetical protein AAFO62_04105 [Pseudomonadota bacterium]
MKFLAGLVFGVGAAFAYVRFGVELPTVLQIPGLVQNAAIASAVDADLYDLDKPITDRRRAFEIYLQSQSKQAVGIDAAEGHPFLAALYRRWARRKARQLSGQWGAFDTALAKPNLRKVLADAHGTDDTSALKRAMLWKAYEDETFLKQWMRENGGLPTQETLRTRLREIGRRDPPLQ